MRFFKNQEAMEFTNGIGIYLLYIYQLLAELFGWSVKNNRNFEACKNASVKNIRKSYEIRRCAYQNENRTA